MCDCPSGLFIFRCKSTTTRACFCFLDLVRNRETRSVCTMALTLGHSGVSYPFEVYQYDPGDNKRHNKKRSHRIREVWNWTFFLFSFLFSLSDVQNFPELSAHANAPASSAKVKRQARNSLSRRLLVFNQSPSSNEWFLIVVVSWLSQWGKLNRKNGRQSPTRRVPNTSTNLLSSSTAVFSTRLAPASNSHADFRTPIEFRPRIHHTLFKSGCRYYNWWSQPLLRKRRTSLFSNFHHIVPCYSFLLLSWILMVP